MFGRRNLRGLGNAGIPNPYVTHVHPYPTRFHGAVYTRPVFDTPYQPAPHAVFKPEDFVSGLGSFAGSSLGNGSLGATSLGLGATGTPIYWQSTNEKTRVLQVGINKVLVANRMSPITVDAKLGPETCAALGICLSKYKSEILAEVDEEIVTEATNLCNQVLASSSAIKSQVSAKMSAIVATQQPVPTVVETPAVTETAITTVSTEPEYVVEEDEVVTEVPELSVEASVPTQSSAKTGWIIGVAAVALLGGGFFLYKKMR